MATTLYGATIVGVEALGVSVEAQILCSLRRFSLVGLPDNALRESKDRVRCAVENSGFSFPMHEVIVSLAPASLPKYGAGFDLTIALSVLAADGKISHSPANKYLILGELALDGRVKGVPGALAVASYAASNGFSAVLLPEANAATAAVVETIPVFAIKSLVHAVEFLNGNLDIERSLPTTKSPTNGRRYSFGDVVGQHNAKRALEIATAGGHNLLMVGPPGVGKSMLAKRASSLLPELNREEMIEITKIHSRSTESPNGQGDFQELITTRPFRNPHHTTSTAGLIGGGSNAVPGEISLAHCGVLFLDELTEFNRNALESLREPLENRKITISRANYRITLPSDFILIAAMNPCPCGKKGSTEQNCTCSLTTMQKYNAKLSAPLLDRIDLHIWVPQISVDKMQAGNKEADPTDKMIDSVRRVRQVQSSRYQSHKVLNGTMATSDIRRFCICSSPVSKVVESAARRLQLSARGYTRLLKVSRTIADLDDCAEIQEKHVCEAISYRSFIKNVPSTV